MVKQLKSGTLDFIGCARPSIADPWLPRKIDEGRIEDIRECIGCNICVAGDMTGGLSRCTQNPTFMEEWRKGWHPETIKQKSSDSTVLIVGAGPAGLEAALSLGKRGYAVTVAEADSVLGGRVARESQLPGLSAWGRVRDYREYQISQLANVQVYRESRLSASDVLDFGFNHVAIATGSQWRNDGVGRHHVLPMANDGSVAVLSPDDLMNGKIPSGSVVVFDDDHYYMGSVLSELLVKAGCSVRYVSPSAYVAEWTLNTLEQGFIHKRMHELGVEIELNRAISRIASGELISTDCYSGDSAAITCDAVVLVTARRSLDSLYTELLSEPDRCSEAGIKSVTVLGDAEAPAPIAWAVYSGHRFAQELETEIVKGEPPFKREVAALGEL